MAAGQKKDGWDKLQVLSVVFASVAVPYLISEAGNKHNDATQKSANAIRYLQLAISIVREEPKPETRALRDWAVDLLASQTPQEAPLTKEAMNELKSQASFAKYDFGGSDFGYSGKPIEYDFGGGDYSKYEDAPHKPETPADTALGREASGAKTPK